LHPAIYMINISLLGSIPFQDPCLAFSALSLFRKHYVCKKQSDKLRLEQFHVRAGLPPHAIREKRIAFTFLKFLGDTFMFVIRLAPHEFRQECRTAGNGSTSHSFIAKFRINILGSF
jgi:hypothetical protein